MDKREKPLAVGHHYNEQDQLVCATCEPEPPARQVPVTWVENKPEQQTVHYPLGRWTSKAAQ